MKTTNITRKLKETGFKALIGLLLTFIMMYAAPASVVATQPHQSAPAGVGPQLNPYQLLEQSLVSSLSVEKNQLEKYLNALSDTKEFEHVHRKRLDAYRIQLTAYQNILVLPTVEEYQLQEAYSQYKLGLNNLIELESEINQESLAALRNAISRAHQELSSYEKQKAEIAQETTKSDLQDQISKKLKELIETVSAQIEILKDIEEIFIGLLDQTRQLYNGYQAIAEQFDKKIAEKKRQRLLERKSIPLSQFSVQQIQNEAGQLKEKIKKFLGWEAGVSDPRVYTFFVLTYILLFILLEFLLAYSQRFFTRERKRFKESEKFWQYLTLKLVQRSVLLLGAILFIDFFPVKPAYELTPLFVLLRLLADILTLLLIVRWGLSFSQVLASYTKSPDLKFLGIYLKTLLYGIFAFGMVYYLLKAGLCFDCTLLIMARLIFELALVVWSVLFWRRFRFYFRNSELSEYPWFIKIRPALPVAGYLIVLVGLFFEIIGYGAMAAFWYISLGKTAVVLFWFGILYMALKEISLAGATESKADEEEPEPEGEKPLPIRIFIMRLSKAGLLVLLLLGVLMAWGARSSHFGAIFYAFNYQISLGDIHISLMDLAIAVFIVFLTHALIVVWKAILKEKILAKRDLEPGLKESIITITGYIGWLLGILIVFRVIGVSMASLAVIFGAVGIGIGFGLQNIFNNFLSGIILLFERPIQVGDVVEVNGTWGTVTKIKVRSTQVKTYDNADLIIPNADLISRELTNWSFKDARVRRTINIGVAYGSDVDLVMETLNNIAVNHPRVFRRPAPDVLFSDFGDSALIFMLRFWAHIDYFLAVETDIRRSIDKEFKELGVTIPFPQRDIYIKESQDALPVSPAAE